jgi:hypothetical protein
MIRLEKLLTWTSAITYDEGHAINEYIMQVGFYNTVDDDRQQAVAYERMKWWINSAMTDAVLISRDDPFLSAYQKTRQRVMVLPDDPVDHLVTVMLYFKLNAIMEGRLIIDELKLSSDQGDNVWYLYNEMSDPVGLDHKSWWLDPRPIWHDRETLQSEQNVFNLARESDWSDLGLGWGTDEQDSRVVYADFGKNAKK